MKNILHITNWFPDRENPFNGLFIKNHIESLSRFRNYILHFEVSKSQKPKFLLRFSDQIVVFKLEIPLPWIIIEWISFCGILSFWFILFYWKKISLINLHISYPNAARLSLLKKLLRKKIIITEHWSAFHFNFHLPKNKHRKFHSMFDETTQWIAVSDSLKEDIIRFSGGMPIRIATIPNVVDTKKFKNVESLIGNYFLAVSRWKNPKRPDIIIESFSRVAIKFPNLKLIMAGDGPLLPEMKQQVKKYGLNNKVEFIGWTSAVELAMLLNGAVCLVHCSDYETFSVICAESLCCGTPILASAVGGIREYFAPGYGYLVEDNSVELFSEKMDLMLKNLGAFERKKISNETSKKFCKEKVGEEYARILESNL